MFYPLENFLSFFFCFKKFFNFRRRFIFPSWESLLYISFRFSLSLSLSLCIYLCFSGRRITSRTIYRSSGFLRDCVIQRE